MLIRCDLAWEMNKIAVIGGGGIGEALLAGLVVFGFPAGDQIVVGASTDRSGDRGETTDRVGSTW